MSKSGLARVVPPAPPVPQTVPRSEDEDRLAPVASAKPATWKWLAVVVVVCLALWLPRLRGPIDLRYDAGVYYVTAKALVEGKGYALLNEPGEILSVQYPPLLSVIAAVPMVLAGTTSPAVAGHWLRLLYMLMYVVYGCAVFLLARRFMAERYALAATLVCVLHTILWFLSDMLFAELPVALVTVLFLLASGVGSDRRPRPWLAGGLAVASYLLRTAGIALLAAWVGESLFRRRYRQMAVRAAAAILPIVGWQAYGAWVKGSDQFKHPAYPYQRADYMYYNVAYAENMTYVDPFKPELGRISLAGWAERVAANVADAPAVMGEAVSSTSTGWDLQVEKFNRRVSLIQIPPWSVKAGMSLLGLLVAAGIVLLAVRGEWLMALYCVSTIGLICLTPWRGQFARYLTPSTAPLAIALFVLLVALLHRLSAAGAGRWRRPARLAFAGMTFFLVGQQVYLLVQNVRRKHQVAFYYDDNGAKRPYRLIFYDERWRRHDEGLNWLKERVRPNDVVASVTPFTFYLATGTKSIMPPFEVDVRREQAFLDAVPVTYIVVDNLDFLDVTRRYLQPMVDAYPERWRLVYNDPNGGPRIYQRVGPPLAALADGPSRAVPQH